MRIAPAGSDFYLHGMAARLLRLLTLVALLLMPLGMATAPAAVEHHDAASTPRHCPDQGSKHDVTGFAECTMACAAALPVLDFVQVLPLPIPATPFLGPRAIGLPGLGPETATPPPKSA